MILKSKKTIAIIGILSSVNLTQSSSRLFTKLLPKNFSLFLTTAKATSLQPVTVATSLTKATTTQNPQNLVKNTTYQQKNSKNNALGFTSLRAITNWIFNLYVNLENIALDDINLDDNSFKNHYLMKKLQELDSNSLLKLLHKSYNQSKKETLTKLYINKNFEKLKAYELKELLGFISNKQKQEQFAQQHINQHWKTLEGYDLLTLLSYIQKKQKQEQFAQQHINQHWKTLDEYDLLALLPYIQKEQKQEQFAQQYINQHWQTLERYNLLALLPYIQNKKEQNSLKKDLFMIPEKESFSTQYINDNYEFLIYDSRTVKHEIRELALEMMNYQHEQEKQNNVVYFHGQHWNWKQYADLYKAVYSIDHATPHDYIFLRFTQKYINLKQEKIITAKGIQPVSNTCKDLLFVNRSLFANEIGANTVSYVQNNFDQSTFLKRNQQKFYEIFKNAGYEQEFKLLKKEHPELLQKYSELHQKASQYGNFIVITMPRKTAAKISYACEPGGYKSGEYNQHEAGWLSCIWKHKIPFMHEYCITLGPTILNPENAQKAGITIKEYNAANPGRVAERNKVLEQIIEPVKKYKEQK